ncbi:MAG: hypothetical protein HYR94_23995 [Chloroflexi bacterium]|nr:hypothetical protein [Chloroflexota bacterium]
MNRRHYFYLIVRATLLILAGLACGPLGSSVSEPKVAVAPITIGSDLTQIDVCQAIPQEDIEAVMGRKLVSAPQHFEYTDTGDTSGCSYDAGKDANGDAYFGYVVLTPIDVYNNQPLYQKVDVSGIGDSAYFNNGADARQLWVELNNKVAFVVAFGDRPNEDGARAIAKLIAAAIK